MGNWVSIDFGTCNTTAAIEIDGKPHVISNGYMKFFPTVAIVSPTGIIQVCQEAEALRKEMPDCYYQEFKLNIVSVIEREPGTEPTPQELETTIAKVNTLPVKVLFTEPQYSPAAAETIAKETGAKIYQLDPVVTGEANLEAMDAYISAMKKNMNILKEALQ